MRYGVITAAVAALVAAGAPNAAVAAPEPPVLTLRAERGASARFHVAETTRFSLQRATVLATGGYGGAVLYTDRRSRIGGVVTFGGLSVEATEAPLYLGNRFATVLEPGWYRVVVLGDATTEVRVPLDAGKGVTVDATVPEPQTFRTQHQDLAPLSPAAPSLALPLPRARTPMYVVARARLESGYSVTGGHRVRVCATRGAACGGGVSATGSSPGYGAVVAAFSAPARLLHGARAVRAEALVTPAAPARLSLAVLVFGAAPS